MVRKHSALRARRKGADAACFPYRAARYGQPTFAHSSALNPTLATNNMLRRSVLSTSRRPERLEALGTPLARFNPTGGAPLRCVRVVRKEGRLLCCLNAIPCFLASTHHLFCFFTPTFPPCSHPADNNNTAAPRAPR